MQVEVFHSISHEANQSRFLQEASHLKQLRGLSLGFVQQLVCRKQISGATRNRNKFDPFWICNCTFQKKSFWKLQANIPEKKLVE